MRVKLMCDRNVPKVVFKCELSENFSFQNMCEDMSLGYNHYDIDTMKNDFQNQVNVIEIWEEDGKTHYSTNSNPYMIYKLKKELVDEGFYKQYDPRIQNLS